MKFLQANRVFLHPAFILTFVCPSCRITTIATTTTATTTITTTLAHKCQFAELTIIYVNSLYFPALERGSIIVLGKYAAFRKLYLCDPISAGSFLLLY